MSNEIIFVQSEFMRNENVYRDEVLEKVKIIPSLKVTDEVTVEMASNYYEVPIETIKSVIKRHRDEFNDYQEVRVLKGKSLKEFCEVHPEPDKIISSKTRSLQLINRRGLLRLGMVLTESEVAISIRNYLLNVEEISDKKQREWAVEREISKRNRRMLTDAIKEFCAGLMKGHEYSTYTNLVYSIVFDCKASDLRELYDLEKKEQIRDSLTTEDLEKVVEVEKVITSLLKIGKDYEYIKSELQKYKHNFN